MNYKSHKGFAIGTRRRRLSSSTLHLVCSREKQQQRDVKGARGRESEKERAREREREREQQLAVLCVEVKGMMWAPQSAADKVDQLPLITHQTHRRQKELEMREWVQGKRTQSLVFHGSLGMHIRLHHSPVPVPVHLPQPTTPSQLLLLPSQQIQFSTTPIWFPHVLSYRRWAPSCCHEYS